MSLDPVDHLERLTHLKLFSFAKKTRYNCKPLDSRYVMLKCHIFCLLVPFLKSVSTPKPTYVCEPFAECLFFGTASFQKALASCCLQFAAFEFSFTVQSDREAQVA